MKDSWHALLKLADYHRGVLGASTVVAILGAYLVGCEAKTSSLIASGEAVTPRQLRAEVRQLESALANRRNHLVTAVADFNDEVSRFNEATQTATLDLKHQQELRSRITRTIGGLASDAVEGRFNPVSAISAMVTLITAGAATGLAVDNARKGRVIKLLKDQDEGSDATPRHTSAPGV